MSTSRSDDWRRRDFLTHTSLAGAAGLLGVRPDQAAAEPPPETTRLRMVRIPSICQSPQYLAEELLRAEGFTDVQYISKQGTEEIETALASGEVDLNGHFAAPLILRVEAGDPVVILAGEHVGCYELFGTGAIRSIRDLKGKTVAIPALDSSRYVFLASMVAYVGLDPRKDINFVRLTGAESIHLLAEGKIDAYLGFPPEPQELRARKIGHVLVNSAMDRPWSQYFCCMLAGNREFVRKHPVATKRALRAILKSTDVCALEPERVARLLWIRTSRRITTTHSRRSGRSRMVSGGRSTPKTRCVSTHCDSTKRGWSNRVRRRSSPRAPTGASSTS